MAQLKLYFDKYPITSGVESIFRVGYIDDTGALTQLNGNDSNLVIKVLSPTNGYTLTSYTTYFSLIIEPSSAPIDILIQATYMNNTNRVIGIGRGFARISLIGLMDLSDIYASRYINGNYIVTGTSTTLNKIYYTNNNSFTSWTSCSTPGASASGSIADLNLDYRASTPTLIACDRAGNIYTANLLTDTFVTTNLGTTNTLTRVYSNPTLKQTWVLGTGVLYTSKSPNDSFASAQFTTPLPSTTTLGGMAFNNLNNIAVVPCSNPGGIGANCYYSVNGGPFTPITFPSSLNVYQLTTATFFQGNFYMVGDNPAGRTLAIVSPDGINWSHIPGLDYEITPGVFTNIVDNLNDELLVVSSTSGRVYYSIDGVTWAPYVNGQTAQGISSDGNIVFSGQVSGANRPSLYVDNVISTSISFSDIFSYVAMPPINYVNENDIKAMLVRFLPPGAYTNNSDSNLDARLSGLAKSMIQLYQKLDNPPFKNIVDFTDNIYPTSGLSEWEELLTGSKRLLYQPQTQYGALLQHLFANNINNNSNPYYIAYNISKFIYLWLNYKCYVAIDEKLFDIEHSFILANNSLGNKILSGGSTKNVAITIIPVDTPTPTITPSQLTQINIYIRNIMRCAANPIVSIGNPSILNNYVSLNDTYWGDIRQGGTYCIAYNQGILEEATGYQIPGNPNTILAVNFYLDTTTKLVGGNTINTTSGTYTLTAIVTTTSTNYDFTNNSEWYIISDTSNIAKLSYNNGVQNIIFSGTGSVVINAYGLWFNQQSITFNVTANETLSINQLGDTNGSTIRNTNIPKSTKRKSRQS